MPFDVIQNILAINGLPQRTEKLLMEDILQLALFMHCHVYLIVHVSISYQRKNKLVF